MQDDRIVIARKKIVGILKLKGPSLPVQVARGIELSSLFAGALLSELAKEKTIKISHMKVGGSPLYFLAGQEPLLEKFHTYLPGKEKEAFLLLQKKNVLEDKTQVPAIRVALRNLKDFAFPFPKNNEIFWRFHTANLTNSTNKQNTIKPEKLKTQAEIKGKIQLQELASPNKEKQLDIGLKTEVKKEIPKQKQEKPKKEKQIPEFPLKIINTLQNNNIEILEQKDIKKREFSAIIRIDSTLGKIRFLCIAKDKKIITESDLRLILQKTQSLKMPALVLFPQDINKKALSYAQTCPLLKLKKLG